MVTKEFWLLHVLRTTKEPQLIRLLRVLQATPSDVVSVNMDHQEEYNRVSSKMITGLRESQRGVISPRLLTDMMLLRSESTDPSRGPPERKQECLEPEVE